MWLVVAAVGCVHAPPQVDGVPAVPRSSGGLWTPPPQAVPPLPPSPPTPIPADLTQRIHRLTLADVIDVALLNTPVTRATWEEARAAAYAYGAAGTRLLPTVDASASLGRSKTLAVPGARTVAERTQYGPALTLTYLLFDFGGRSGTIETTRQNLFAAGLTHNATVQNTVLQVEQAYFSYMSTKSLFGAQESVVKEAQANLAAAQQRHDVGLATIADVLQAKTALSEAQLSLESTQGALQATRGALAAAMGLPANAPYDVDATPPSIPVGSVATTVDSLIDAAVRDRPDVQAARAAARAAAAQVQVTRAAGLPSLTLGGNAGRTYASPSQYGGNTYGLSLGVQLPLTTALNNRYNVLGAQAQARAATARADALQQQVTQQVFTSYYALQTAAQRVTTADDLLASATASEQVAAGRYREGVGSIIDLLTAQSALADARAQQVQARWQWYTSLAQLAHDVGVLGVHGEAPLKLSDSSSTSPR